MPKKMLHTGLLMLDGVETSITVDFKAFKIAMAGPDEHRRTLDFAEIKATSEVNGKIHLETTFDKLTFKAENDGERKIWYELFKKVVLIKN